MLTDGLIDLYEAGRISGRRKSIHAGRLVFTFGFGSRKLYDAVDRNPGHALPTRGRDQRTGRDHAQRQCGLDQQHDRRRLSGQAASESDGHRHISGTAASCSSSRRLCLEGWQVVHLPVLNLRTQGRAQEPHRPRPQAGTTVTTPRTDTMYVVTEYGAVNLKGKSIPERARALIAIAHPDFREDLEREAHQRGLLQRGRLQ